MKNDAQTLLTKGRKISALLQVQPKMLKWTGCVEWSSVCAFGLNTVLSSLLGKSGSLGGVIFEVLQI